MEHMASVTVTIHKMGEADANITVLFTTEDVSSTTGYAAATGDKGDSSKTGEYIVSVNGGGGGDQPTI